MKHVRLWLVGLAAWQAFAAHALELDRQDEFEQCEPPAAVIRDEQIPIRVGYTPFGSKIDERLMLHSLSRSLTADKLGHPVSFHRYAPRQLIEAVREKQVDIVFSESPLYVSLVPWGVRSVTTFVCDMQPDPNRNDGTAVIVANDSPARTLEQLRGLRLAAAAEDSFSGYLYVQAELLARKLGSAERFFSKRTFLGANSAGDVNAEIYRAVIEGRSDVGFLPLCALEDLARTDASVLERVRVIEARQNETVTDCRHSTALYPAATLAVTPHISASMSKSITMDLLTQPKGESGFMWSVASDFQSVDKLLQRLQIGPYAYLKQTGISRIWRDYKTEIIALVLTILALIAHGLRSQWLVRKRETELKASIELHLAQREKMQRLQKAGVVGQISGLVAHELRQPLAAISLYAEGLEEMVRKESISKEEMLEILHSMTTDAARASDIVERVRQYAKKKTEAEPTSLREAFEKAEEMTAHFGNGAVRTTVEDFQDASILINPLDLQLVLANLIKNAKEAAAQQREHTPSLLVRARLVEGFACLELLDNGPALSDRQLAMLNEVVTSAKPDGLGLGLAIARSIVEGTGGTIVFRRRSQGFGLKTCVKLPVSAMAAKQNKE